MVKRAEPTAKKASPKKHNQTGKINTLRSKLQAKSRAGQVSAIKAGDERKRKKEQELKTKTKQETLQNLVKSGAPVVISSLNKSSSQSSTSSLNPVQTAKEYAKATRVQHIRTAWYMTTVDEISTTGPTATGTLPKEYKSNKYFIPSPDGPNAIQGLPTKFKIMTASLAKLSSSDRKRAEDLLGVKMPPKDRYFVKPPRVFYFNSARLKDHSPFKKFKLHSQESGAFTKPKMAVTAFSLNQIPRLRHHTRDVEIVFVGRSNVGKSSLINALTNSDIAKAGRTPGKTQSLNFYALNPEALRRHRSTCAALARSSQIDTDRIFSFVQKLDPALTIPATETQQRTIDGAFKKAGNGPVMFLVDVPGYGHASAPDWIVDKWNVMLGSYLRLRSPLNFPLDPIQHWTTKEYLQLLVELKKNRAKPRKARTQAGAKFKHQTPSTAAGGDADDVVDQSDDEGDEEQHGNDMSDFENDSMVLFEQALEKHIQTVKGDMEQRVANTEYIMEQLRKLEDLEDALNKGDTSVDVDMIRIQRDALVDLHTRLNAKVSTDPLNTTVTNLPSSEVSITHEEADSALALKDEHDQPTPHAENKAFFNSSRKDRPLVKPTLKRIPLKFNLHQHQPQQEQPPAQKQEQSQDEAVSKPPAKNAKSESELSEEYSEDFEDEFGTEMSGDDEGDEISEGSEREHDDNSQVDDHHHVNDPLDSYARYKALQRELKTDIQPLHTRLPPLDHLGDFHGSPLKNVVVLLDARAGVTKYDLQFLNFLEKYHISHQVVLTKIDRFTTHQLEGAAFSVAQDLFPHEYVKVLQKTQPLSLDAFPDGKLPKNAPSFTINSPEQDRLWVQSRKLAPRKYCSPLLLGVSAEHNINIDVLRKSIMHNVLDRL